VRAVLVGVEDERRAELRGERLARRVVATNFARRGAAHPRTGLVRS
jgi:hypothetical protein